MENENIDIEQQARAQGWVPVEEFRGGPEKHKTAEEFIEFGKKSQAVQKERNDKLLTEITALKTQVGSYQETVNSFRTTHEKEMAAVKLDAYNRAKAELTAERRMAIREADEEKVEELDQKISNLKAPTLPEEDKPTKTPVINQEYVEWVAANPWFEQDQTMREYAEFIGEKISKDGVTTPDKFYSTINERVKAQFPGKFPGQKEEIQDVESSTTGGGHSPTSVKGYKDLPADAKSACDRYIAQGLYKTREEYVKVYNS